MFAFGWSSCGRKLECPAYNLHLKLYIDTSVYVYTCTTKRCLHPCQFRKSCKCVQNVAYYKYLHRNKLNKNNRK